MAGLKIRPGGWICCVIHRQQKTLFSFLVFFVCRGRNMLGGNLYFGQPALLCGLRIYHFRPLSFLSSC